MSYLLNEPARFVEEMTDGFVAAHSDVVRRVGGGVARRRPTPAGQVAVVIGGGSGHYPAFAGLVGPGLAHGAAMGNVFASPSAQQVRAVAKAVESGAGVLLVYGNYAGDVLNFDQAQAWLREEGVPCRTVVVTDDISSAPDADRERRRGVAGDLVVFKAAVWAAEQGLDLDAVTAFAQSANGRTRTLGVAFSGCTLPGAPAPLFTVPPGRMAVGMGIHGEPGISESELPTADELATLLVDRVLASAPTGAASGRVAVLLNGLGAVKSEELFVTYRKVAALLQERGLVVVRPEVGEMVTSFEMAGVSLTVSWLDTELEQAWVAPAHGPGYHRAHMDPALPKQEETEDPHASRQAFPQGSPESRTDARRVLQVLHHVKDALTAEAEELGRLDAVAGDGDHGIGMQRGVVAAVDAAEHAVAAGAGAATTLSAAADAWGEHAGGTSGALWQVLLGAVARHCDDTAPLTGKQVRAGVDAAAEAVVAFGGAQPGDKTMVDAVLPFARAFGRGTDEGLPLTAAWPAAAGTAAEAAAGTATLVPRLGRARPHAERSLGTPDPGATSFAVVVRTVAQSLHDSPVSPS